MKPEHTAFESLMRQAAREVEAVPGDKVWAGIEAGLPTRAFPLWGKALIALGSAAAIGLLLWLAIPRMEPVAEKANLVSAPADPIQATPPPTAQPSEEVQVPALFEATEPAPVVATPPPQQTEAAPIQRAMAPQPELIAPAAVVAADAPAEKATPAPQRAEISLAGLTGSGTPIILAKGLIQPPVSPVAMAEPTEEQPTKAEKREMRKERRKAQLRIRMPLTARHMRQQIGRDFSFQLGPEAQLTRRYYGALSGGPNIWLPIHYDWGVRGEIALSPHIRVTTGFRASQSESVFFAAGGLDPTPRYQDCLTTLESHIPPKISNLSLH